MNLEQELTIDNGKIILLKEEINCYRGTDFEPYGCVVYMENDREYWVYESFDYVDSLYDL